MSASGFSVYVVTNMTDGRAYVGITSRDPARRWREHQRDAAGGKPYALHRAMQTHGVAAFRFDVVAVLETWEAACEREHAEIAARRTYGAGGYNRTRGGEGTLGAIWRPESRERLRSVALARPPLTPAVRAKIAATLTGRPGTKATTAQVEALRLRSTGRVASAETRRRLSESHRGIGLGAESRAKVSAALRAAYANGTRRVRPVLVGGVRYATSKEAAWALGVTPSAIIYRIRAGKAAYAD